MASVVSIEMNAIRRLLGDRRPNDYVFSGSLLEELLNYSLEDLCEEMGIGKIETAVWVTLIAGTDTYVVTLPAGVVALGHLHELVANSLAWPLTKLSREQILERRAGSGTPPQGHPVTGYNIYETTTQVLTLIVDPVPLQADTLSAIWEPMHAVVTAAYGTNAAINLSKRGLAALRLRVAAKAVNTVNDEALSRLKLNREVAQKWMAQSQSLALGEYVRLNQGERLGSVSRAR